MRRYGDVRWLGLLLAAGPFLACSKILGIDQDYYVECYAADDCPSRVCKAFFCEAPTCADGVQNGGETDVDCGGSACPGCGDGMRCASPGDCAGGFCTHVGTCCTPPCPIYSQRFGDSDEQAAIWVATAVDGAGNAVVTGDFRGTIAFGETGLTSAGATDVFVAKLDPAGEPVWSRRFGGPLYDIPFGVAVDRDGNVVVVGEFSGTVDFGGESLTSESGPGSHDLFIVKLDPAGGHLWSKRFGDAHDESPRGVATDRDGNIVVVGFFTGAIDFGGGPLVNTEIDQPCSMGCNDACNDIFVAKLDPLGGHLWSKRFGAEDLHEAYGVAIDSASNVVVAGRYCGELDFSGGVSPLPIGIDGDVFVVKLDPSGDHLWSRAYGGYSTQDAWGVAVDPDDNVVVAGRFAWEIDFSGGEAKLSSAGDVDVFVLKLDPQGDHVWSRGFGTGSADEARALAVDDAGDVFLGGVFGLGKLDFGGPPLVNDDGLRFAFLARLDRDASHVWSKGWRTNGDFVVGLAVEPVGSAVFVGDFDADIDFGLGTLYAHQSKDLFVVKFAP